MPYKGICIDCPDGAGEKWIINAKGRCEDCQYKKNHGGKSKFEVYKEREEAKPNKTPKLNRKLPKKRKKQPKKVKEPTGEYNVFLEIWEEREHRCVNCKMNLDRFVCRETGNPSAFLFSHIKSKGARGDLRLLKTNIELNCPECHMAHEAYGDEFYNKRKDLYSE